MSVQAFAQAIKYSPLEGEEYVVHLALADSCGGGDDPFEVWWRDGTPQALTEWARVSPAAVDRAVENLRSLGWLTSFGDGIHRLFRPAVQRSGGKG